MVIITGVRFAGKVDAVPRIGHVATRFFHLYYVPLIPLGTYLVTREGDTDFAGVALPLSGKSILVGWLRTAAWIGSIVAGVMLFTGLGRANHNRLILGIFGLLAAALALWLLYRLKPITHASYERATDIAQRIGLSAEQRLMLEVAYGRLNADQAERELARLYEAASKAVG